MRQCWLELIKDYDLVIKYHEGKANMWQRWIKYEVHTLTWYKLDTTIWVMQGFLKVESGRKGARDGWGWSETVYHDNCVILDGIRKGQLGDVKLERVRAKMRNGINGQFELHDDGTIRYLGQWCVPMKFEKLKRQIMEEGHNTPYSVHPGVTSYTRISKDIFSGQKWKKKLQSS